MNGKNNNFQENDRNQIGIVKIKKNKTWLPEVATQWIIMMMVVLAAVPVLGYAATPTYTGCVNLTGIETLPAGMIYNIKMGTVPSSACSLGDFVASFSAGDITGVVAGNGLSGGGQNGNVTLSIRTGGITNTMLANNSVTSNKIANKTVKIEDLAFDPATQAELNAHNHDGRYARSNQSCSVGDVVTGVNADGILTCDTPSASHDHDDRYYNKSYVDTLETRIARLEGLLDNVTRSGNEIYITGANVNIRSGSGATDGATNGLGNLVIGYNELRNPGDLRTGSHNLVIGKQNYYSSYGGLVAGYWNTIDAPYASISGGEYNWAPGNYSSISGGHMNWATGVDSSVSGGQYNKARGYSSSVSGGMENNASAYYSSISGGYLNTARGESSSVSGGINRPAAGNYDWAAGGLWQDY